MQPVPDLGLNGKWELDKFVPRVRAFIIKWRCYLLHGSSRRSGIGRLLGFGCEDNLLHNVWGVNEGIRTNFRPSFHNVDILIRRRNNLKQPRIAEGKF